jgi:hypothetical protein
VDGPASISGRTCFYQWTDLLLSVDGPASISGWTCFYAQYSPGREAGFCTRKKEVDEGGLLARRSTRGGSCPEVDEGGLLAQRSTRSTREASPCPVMFPNCLQSGKGWSMSIAGPVCGTFVATDAPSTPCADTTLPPSTPCTDTTLPPSPPKSCVHLSARSFRVWTGLECHTVRECIPERHAIGSHARSVEASRRLNPWHPRRQSSVQKQTPYSSPPPPPALLTAKSPTPTMQLCTAAAPHTCATTVAGVVVMVPSGA